MLENKLNISEIVKGITNKVEDFFSDVHFSKDLINPDINVKKINVNPRVYYSELTDKSGRIPILKYDVEITITGNSKSGAIEYDEVKKLFDIFAKKLTNELSQELEHLLTNIKPDRKDVVIKAYNESSVKLTGPNFVYTGFLKITGGFNRNVS
jgi:hypothetical protein